MSDRSRAPGAPGTRRGDRAEWRRLFAEICDGRVEALALGEVAPQRLTSSQRLTSVNFMEYVQSGWFGVSLVVPDSAFHVMKRVAEKDPDRRFRFEALLVLNLVRFEGTRKQRRETLELLERLASDEDVLVAGLAEWARDTRIALSDYTEMQY